MNWEAHYRHGGEMYRNMCSLYKDLSAKLVIAPRSKKAMWRKRMTNHVASCSVCKKNLDVNRKGK